MKRRIQAGKRYRVTLPDGMGCYDAVAQRTLFGGVVLMVGAEPYTIVMHPDACAEVEPCDDSPTPS